MGTPKSGEGIIGIVLALHNTVYVSLRLRLRYLIMILGVKCCSAHRLILSEHCHWHCHLNGYSIKRAIHWELARRRRRGVRGWGRLFIWFMARDGPGVVQTRGACPLTLLSGEETATSGIDFQGEGGVSNFDLRPH
jgi:hypothetical protein